MGSPAGATGAQLARLVGLNGITKNPPAFIDQIPRQGNDSGGLSHTTALVGNQQANHRDRISIMAFRTISTSFVVHLRYEVSG
jgi:hypothetical protein